MTFLVFEPEEIVVRVDEILRFEPAEDRPTSAHFAQDVPANARSKVFTKNTGWFYSQLDTTTILERLIQALDIN